MQFDLLTGSGTLLVPIFASCGLTNDAFVSGLDNDQIAGRDEPERTSRSWKPQCWDSTRACYPQRVAVKTGFAEQPRESQRDVPVRVNYDHQSP
jgi:hypothetical protein